MTYISKHHNVANTHGTKNAHAANFSNVLAKNAVKTSNMGTVGAPCINGGMNANTGGAALCGILEQIGGLLTNLLGGIMGGGGANNGGANGGGGANNGGANGGGGANNGGANGGGGANNGGWNNGGECVGVYPNNGGVHKPNTSSGVTAKPTHEKTDADLVALAKKGTGAFSSQGALQASYNVGRGEAWDNKHWSEIARHYDDAVIKTDDKGNKYIHVASKWEGINTRWIKPGKSEQNPHCLPVKISPVALDLNGDGKISTTGFSTARNSTAPVGETIAFDLDGDGTKEQVEWITGGDGLVVDMTKIGANGEIDGNALMGDQGGRYTDGYQKMATYDQNGDGQLTGGEMANMGVWVDANGDGDVDAGELRSAAEAGVTQLSTQRNDVVNERGETLMQSSANSGQMLTEDVWFAQK